MTNPSSLSIKANLATQLTQNTILHLGDNLLADKKINREIHTFIVYPFLYAVIEIFFIFFNLAVKLISYIEHEKYPHLHF